jgi:flagellar biosynthesis regulator FlaF
MSGSDVETEFGGLTLDALRLSSAAVQIDQARLKRGQAPSALVEALENNLQLWIAIKTVMQQPASPLPDALRSNLIRLADFVANSTLSGGLEMADSTIDALVNVNLQVSEGLLEAAR